MRRQKGYNIVYAPHPCKMKLPPISQISSLFFDESICDRFLYTHGCYYQVLACPRCGGPAHAQVKFKRFRCGRKGCRAEISLKSHTFFAGTRLKSNEIMHLAYLWLNRNLQTQAINATRHSPNTVTALYGHFRQLVASTLTEEDDMIGGEGIMVEIDETKLGKRKYHRGHRVDGVWILVGVEKTAERKIFLKRIEDRSANTLQEIIRTHVKDGSIVCTDLWKGYASLEQNCGLEHLTVNHSLWFKDPSTGVNTNTVEGNNNGLKIAIRPRNRTKDVDDHLEEFVWRRKNSHRLWDAFIEALKDVHYDLE